MATVRARSHGVWEVSVFLGRDVNGRPVQVSQTVHGGKKEAVCVADEIASRSVSPKTARRNVAGVLDAGHIAHGYAVNVRDAQAVAYDHALPTLIADPKPILEQALMRERAQDLTVDAGDAINLRYTEARLAENSRRRAVLGDCSPSRVHRTRVEQFALDPPG